MEKIISKFQKKQQIKTINYYTHFITLPITLKQTLLLPGPVLCNKKDFASKISG